MARSRINLREPAVLTMQVTGIMPPIPGAVDTAPDHADTGDLLATGTQLPDVRSSEISIT